MSNSVSKRVGLAALIMMASVLLSRVMGLLREIVIASLAGASAAVDAYQVAFIIPEILNHVVATGFLSITFIPIFTNYLASGRERDGWHIFSVILTTLGTILLFLVIVAMWFAPHLIDFFAPGLDNQQQIASAVRMTRIIIPAQLFFFAGGLLMAVQFAKERFAIPALAPLIYNLGIILGGVLLNRYVGMEGFAWGVLAGAIAGNFFVQLAGARKVGMRLQLTLNFRHPELRKYLLLTLPLMVGLTMTFSTEFFLRFFGSYLSEGGIASLNYGLRVMFILVGLFGQAAGVASFPFLARLVAEGKMQAMNDLLNQTLRRYIAVVIPFSVLMMLLSHEITLLLFQRGQFDAEATNRTAGVLVWLLAGAFAFASQTVVVRGYYAKQNTIFPTILMSGAVILSLPVYWLGLEYFGINGIAIALSFSAVLQTVLLYALWNRQTQNIGSRRVYLFFAKIILLSVAIGVILFFVKAMIGIDFRTMQGSLLNCILIGSFFLVLFVLSGYALRIVEIVNMTDRAIAKLGIAKRQNG